jgi:hypothetical protein
MCPTTRSAIENAVPARPYISATSPKEKPPSEVIRPKTT